MSAVTEPVIQYARTSDGVNIAYWTMGEGSSLIVLPTRMVMASYTWRLPERWRDYERLSSKRKVIRLDFRNTGDSDRNPADRSLAAHMRDVEAVARALELEEFAILGPQWSGPIAIACAAQLPGMVSKLLLLNTAPRGANLVGPARPSLRLLAEKDWALYTQAIAHDMVGWSKGEEAARLAAMLRETETPEHLNEVWETVEQFDASRLLGNVTAPTLVLHGRQRQRPSVSAARQLASRIPNARLAVTDEDAELGYPVSVVQLIEDFLGEGEALQSNRATLASDTSLTPRETEVLRLLAQGRSNREIAEDLVLSERTVARHVANIYESLNLHTRAAVTAFALKNRLI